MKQVRKLKATLASSLLIAGILTVPASIAKEGNGTLEERSAKACQVLEDTHAALKVLRINSDEALNRVQLALDTIDQLDNKFDDYSSANIVGEGNVEYQHYYPEISSADSYCSNYVYLDINQQEALGSDNYNIYLDYPLAKAELMTAKLAIKNGDPLEARYSLKRGMHAIYVNPSFNIAQ
ncbi:MAG: hypothetical protein AAGB35_03180 [Pseudomonadota bacterium]